MSKTYFCELGTIGPSDHRTIGVAITVKKASKHSISKVNDLKSMQYYSLDSLDQ